MGERELADPQLPYKFKHHYAQYRNEENRVGVGPIDEPQLLSKSKQQEERIVINELTVSVGCSSWV